MVFDQLGTLMIDEMQYQVEEFTQRRKSVEIDWNCR